MKISVIVPAYNEEKLIGKCLSSINNQTVPREEYEIIVSNSSSTDSTADIAKRHADKVVTCKKVSAGFGRNFGSQHARSNFLAFIDADTLASPTWLEGIIEALKESGSATGPITPLGGSYSTKAFYKFWSFQSWFSVLIGLPVFPGFNFAVRKDLFKKMGGFKTGNITTEDLDLSLRLRRFKTGFNKKMLVYTSTRRIKELGMVGYIKNAWDYLLFNKSHGWESHRRDF